MGTSTILLTGAAIFLTVGAAGIGYFAGRASVSGDRAAVISEQADTATTIFPKYASPMADENAVADPRAQLFDALERPAAERNRAVRVAMNAWLAADGAAAIMAVRDDPELGDVAERMTQFALFAYPELFVDDPSLLEGVPDERQSITMAARAMVMFDPDAARGLVDSRLSGSRLGTAVLEAADRIERAGQDPRAELETIVAGRDRMNRRIPRVFELVARVAMDDPVAAAELIDDMPTSLAAPATQLMVSIWSLGDPEEAARWLLQKDAEVSGEGLSQLGQGWGQSDFEAANAFADTLTGSKRAVFLAGLFNATHHLSNEELLVWVSRYEDDPVYPDLMMNMTQRIASQDPEAAVALVDGIGNQSVRDQLVPMVSGMWAQNDAESALDWARGLSAGRTRDLAIASIAPLLMGSDMEFDLDRAVDVINEIEDPQVRRGPVWHLLFNVESDDEAIRIGRDHGFDRDAVLELREGRSRMHGSGLVRSFSFHTGGASSEEE